MLAAGDNSISALPQLDLQVEPESPAEGPILIQLCDKSVIPWPLCNTVSLMTNNMCMLVMKMHMQAN